MAIINNELRSIKGYYCDYCGKFHTAEEMKTTYTVEVVGKSITITDKKMSCPTCGEFKDLEEFDPDLWSHLVALIQTRYKDKVWFKVPLYDSKDEIFPKAFKTVRTPEEVEKIADWYCVEVVKATTDEFGLMDVEVELQ